MNKLEKEWPLPIPKTCPHVRSAKVTLIAYDDYAKANVFVLDPTLRGRYVKTDRCVIEVSCPVCGTGVGEPCKSRHGKYWSGTHADRRTAATRLRRNYP